MHKSITPRAALVIGAIFLATISTPAAQIKWACVGNSMTQGVGPNYVGYFPFLRDLLGGGFNLQNDGWAGMCVLKSSGANASYMSSPQFANVFAFQPNVITIKLGTNDSKAQYWVDSANFVRDYTALVDSFAHMASHPQIWLCYPVPAFCPATGTNPNNNVIKNGIIPRINQIAAAKGLHTIDLYNPIVGHTNYLYSDGIHPDSIGADTIAHIIYRTYMNPTAVANSAHAVSPAANMTAQNHVFMLAGDRLFVSPETAAHIKSVDLYNVNGAYLGSAAVRSNGMIVVDKNKIGRGVIAAKPK
ncbi:MAG: GDSL-type esterase/lipase family protein [Chitinivibrionales bacterium]|nr:GDSL-type esterase/lipase family protein [Chitinivibrionales bacterium]